MGIFGKENSNDLTLTLFFLSLRIFGTSTIGGVALYIVFQNRHLSEEANPSKSVLTVERVTPNVYAETISRL